MFSHLNIIIYTLNISENMTMCASLNNYNPTILFTVERFTIGVEFVQRPMYSMILPALENR